MSQRCQKQSGPSFDHLVGGGDQLVGDFEAERFRGWELMTRSILVASSTGMSAGPGQLPSNFAIFKIPTPFASCFRTFRSRPTSAPRPHHRSLVECVESLGLIS